MLGFSYFNLDPERRYFIGWFYVSFLGIILAVNIIIMLIGIIGTVKLALKRR